MQIKAQTDIEAPARFVFNNVSAFERFERQALRRGAQVRRTDDLPRNGVGTAWDLKFTFRERERHLTPRITSWDAPDGYVVESASGGFLITVTVQVVQLSRERARASIQIDAEAKTLPSRLLLQSLRVGKGALSRKVANRLEAYGVEVEERYRRRAAAQRNVDQGNKA